jgi:hypothetical protein
LLDAGVNPSSLAGWLNFEQTELSQVESPRALFALYQQETPPLKVPVKNNVIET